MNPQWTELGRRRGVRLRAAGSGPPVVVLPGMEGSGESCLDLVLPVVAPEHGPSLGRVILVDYAGEKHRLLGELVDTIAALLTDAVAEPVSWWGQSFGNLLLALTRQRVELPTSRIALVSPFTGLPPARVAAARIGLVLTPEKLYSSTAAPGGKMIFGPDPDDAGGPFFGALAAMHPLTVYRRLSWLSGKDFAGAFLALKDPLAVWLGESDRLVDLPRQLAFFSALTRGPSDRLTILGSCGHVVLPTYAADLARSGIRDFLSP